MKFNNKGQGALEYLLLIGGAVLIAVIVIALLVGMGSSGQKNAQQNAASVSQAVSSVPVAATLIGVNATGLTTLNVNWTSNGGANATLEIALIGAAFPENGVAITTTNTVTLTTTPPTTPATLSANQVYQARVKTTSAGQPVYSNVVTFTAPAAP